MAGSKRTKFFGEDIEEVLGRGGKRRLRRWYSILGVIAVATAIVFASAFVFSSKSGLIEVARVDVQVSGTLIGFITVAAFFFLGTISSTRKRVAEILTLAHREHSVVLDKTSSHEIFEIVGVLENICADLSGFLLDEVVSVISCFAVAVFLALLAILLVIQTPLVVSLVFIILGIGMFTIVILDMQKMLNLFHGYAYLVQGAILGYSSISELHRRIVGAKD